MDKNLHDKIYPTLNENGVKLAYIFGSYAKGKQGPLSDFDIGIVFGNDISQAQYFDLETKISLEISKILRIGRVDVVNLVAARNPLLKHNIVAGGNPILVKDEEMRFEIEKRIMEEYEDTKYLRSNKYRAIRRQIQEGVFGKAPLSPAQEKSFQKYAH